MRIYPGVDGVYCAVRPGTVLLRGQIFGDLPPVASVCGVTGGKFYTDSDIANRRWRCRSAGDGVAGSLAAAASGGGVDLSLCFVLYLALCIFIYFQYVDPWIVTGAGSRMGADSDRFWDYAKLAGTSRDCDPSSVSAAQPRVFRGRPILMLLLIVGAITVVYPFIFQLLGIDPNVPDWLMEGKIDSIQRSFGFSLVVLPKIFLVITGMLHKPQFY